LFSSKSNQAQTFQNPVPWAKHPLRLISTEAFLRVFTGCKLVQ